MAGTSCISKVSEPGDSSTISRVAGRRQRHHGLRREASAAK